MKYSAKTYAVELVGGLATIVFAIVAVFILLAWAAAGMELFGAGRVGVALQIVLGTLVFIPLLIPYYWLRFKSDAWPGPYTQRLIDAMT